MRRGRIKARKLCENAYGASDRRALGSTGSGGFRHHCATVLAAPLVAASEWRPIPRIDVPVQFESNEYYLVLTQMAAYPTSAFGHTLGNLLSFEDEISNAFDRLFWGF